MFEKLKQSYHEYMQERDLKDTAYARWLDAMAVLRRLRRKLGRKKL